MKTYVSALLGITMLVLNPPTGKAQDVKVARNDEDQVVARIPFTLDDRITIPVRVKGLKELEQGITSSLSTSRTGSTIPGKRARM